jgi:hypothetical protein
MEGPGDADSEGDSDTDGEGGDESDMVDSKRRGTGQSGGGLVSAVLRKMQRMGRRRGQQARRADPTRTATGADRGHRRAQQSQRITDGQHAQYRYISQTPCIRSLYCLCVNSCCSRVSLGCQSGRPSDLTVPASQRWMAGCRTENKGRFGQRAHRILPLMTCLCVCALWPLPSVVCGPACLLLARSPPAKDPQRAQRAQREEKQQTLPSALIRSLALISCPSGALCCGTASFHRPCLFLSAGLPVWLRAVARRADWREQGGGEAISD